MELKVLSLADCECIRKWRNESMISLRTPYESTREMQEDFYRNVICNPDSKHRYWGIISNSGVLINKKPVKELIGMGGITNIQWENRIGEISLLIAPEHQRNGCGKEAAKLLLDKAFNYLNLELIYGECYLCNPVVEFWKKIAKQYEPKNQSNLAMLRKGKYWNGIYFSTLYFDIGKAEYDYYANK